MIIVIIGGRKVMFGVIVVIFKVFEVGYERGWLYREVVFQLDLVGFCNCWL